MHCKVFIIFQLIYEQSMNPSFVVSKFISQSHPCVGDYLICFFTNYIY